MGAALRAIDVLGIERRPATTTKGAEAPSSTDPGGRLPFAPRRQKFMPTFRPTAVLSYSMPFFWRTSCQRTSAPT